MNRIQKLLRAYETQVGLNWDGGLHGAERTWFAIYDPVDERRLRAMFGEFELTTRAQGHEWRHIDVTGAFEEWLAKSEYRESYFEDPEFLEMQYGDFELELQTRIRSEAALADDNTVLAISGVGSLFGSARVSGLVAGIAESINGRLLVFFPGTLESNTYRLLNARDGWNYRAVAITAAG
jgi:hypothetical protein